MGMFDDAFSSAVPGGNMAKPLMIAAGALLLGKMFGSFGGAAPAASASAPQGAANPDQGLIGGLGGLLDRLKQAGQGNVANSWVSTGPNVPIQPAQLNSALGQQTVSDLARQAGVSEQELLSHLAQVLPNLVDKLTPAGRLPTQSEVWNTGRPG